MNDVLWCVIDLTLHLNGLFLLMAYFDAEDPEVTASQIQRDEVSFLCRDEEKCQFAVMYISILCG